VFFPQPIEDVSNATGQAFIDIAIAQVMAIVKDTSSGLSTPCSKCVAALVCILYRHIFSHDYQIVQLSTPNSPLLFFESLD